MCVYRMYIFLFVVLLSVNHNTDGLGLCYRKLHAAEHTCCSCTLGVLTVWLLKVCADV